MVFGHLKREIRQVEHLPPRAPDHRRVGQARTAAAALLRLVLEETRDLGRSDLLECHPVLPAGTARTALALGPQ
jgi:hypothetical protein